MQRHQDDCFCRLGDLLTNVSRKPIKEESQSGLGRAAVSRFHLRQSFGVEVALAVGGHFGGTPSACCPPKSGLI